LSCCGAGWDHSFRAGQKGRGTEMVKCRDLQRRLLFVPCPGSFALVERAICLLVVCACGASRPPSGQRVGVQWSISLDNGWLGEGEEPRERWADAGRPRQASIHPSQSTAIHAAGPAGNENADIILATAAKVVKRLCFARRIEPGLQAGDRASRPRVGSS
jgi:hypothetical protein